MGKVKLNESLSIGNKYSHLDLFKKDKIVTIPHPFDNLKVNEFVVDVEDYNALQKELEEIADFRAIKVLENIYLIGELKSEYIVNIKALGEKEK